MTLGTMLTVIAGTPNARTISPCVAVPLTMSCVVNRRNAARSAVAWVKTGRWPLR